MCILLCSHVFLRSYILLEIALTVSWVCVCHRTRMLIIQFLNNSTCSGRFHISFQESCRYIFRLRLERTNQLKEFILPKNSIGHFQKLAIMHTDCWNFISNNYKIGVMYYKVGLTELVMLFVHFSIQASGNLLPLKCICPLKTFLC